MLRHRDRPNPSRAALDGRVMLSVLLSFEILFAISFVLGLVAWAISPGPKRGILIAVALLFGGSFLQKLWWAWGATAGLGDHPVLGNRCARFRNLAQSNGPKLLARLTASRLPFISP